MKALNLAGQKMDKLTILCRGAANNKHRETLWHCMCECGKRILVSAKYLKHSKRKSCGCHKEKPQSPEEELFKTYKGSSSERGHPFELSFDEFCHLIKQDCFYCGSPPKKYKLKRDNSFLCNGIDRINNNLHYTLGNTVSCCHPCNQAKMALTVEEFYARIKRCYEFLKSKKKGMRYGC